MKLCASSFFFASLPIAALVYGAAPAVAATSCANLASFALPYTSITAAESVPAGTYTAADGSVWPNLPAFCRVAGSIMPTSDSNIHFEVWMPISGWNGKFKGNGNGGFAGSIVYSEMAPDLVRGYATSSTDTGSSADGSFALGHPEKIVDFGYRAHHELAMKGEAITQAFYGTNPKHSYFQGCSGGGAEAQMESQRFPNDYDGIIIGDPANYWTHHYVGAHLWILEALYTSTARTLISRSARTPFWATEPMPPATRWTDSSTASSPIPATAISIQPRCFAKPVKTRARA
jgi:feruloyl esterase